MLAYNAFPLTSVHNCDVGLQGSLSYWMGAWVNTAQIFDVIRLLFLLTEHTKFAKCRLSVLSIAKSYKSDVLTWWRLPVAMQQLMKRQAWLRLSLSYRETLSLAKLSDTVVMRTREQHSSGDYKVAWLKLWRGLKRDIECFPSNYRRLMRQISAAKAHDMHTMYSHFVAENRWPDVNISTASTESISMVICNQLCY